MSTAPPPRRITRSCTQATKRKQVDAFQSTIQEPTVTTPLPNTTDATDNAFLTNTIEADTQLHPPKRLKLFVGQRSRDREEAHRLGLDRIPGFEEQWMNGTSLNDLKQMASTILIPTRQHGHKSNFVRHRRGRRDVARCSGVKPNAGDENGVQESEHGGAQQVKKMFFLLNFDKKTLGSKIVYADGREEVRTCDSKRCDEIEAKSKNE